MRLFRKRMKLVKIFTHTYLPNYYNNLNFSFYKDVMVRHQIQVQVEEKINSREIVRIIKSVFEDPED